VTFVSNGQRHVCVLFQHTIVTSAFLSRAIERASGALRPIGSPPSGCRFRRRVTRLLLWEEYRAANPDGSGYTWLCTTCEAWKQRARPSIRLTHMVGDGVRRFRWRYSQILNRGRRSVRQAKGDFSLFGGAHQPLGFPDRVEVDNSDVT